MNINPKKSAYFVIVLSVLISIALTFIYVPMWKDDIIIPGKGVTEIKWLSDYVPQLKGTLADSRVFILQGEEAGANVLLLSGHHSDEPGGWVANILLAERAVVKKGKLVLIPQANNSAFTHNYPQEAHAQSISIPLTDGSSRTFRHGSRTSNSVEHWPDPEVFVQYPSGQKLSGDEVRNMNRSYPGRVDGTFTEVASYAVQMVARTEKINLQIDMHEAQPEYPFVNAASAHPNAQDIVSLASMGMQLYDLELGVELSPENFRGLSNRELGDIIPGLYAVTMETVNAEQGKIRGITDAILPIEGKDAFYVAAGKLGNLFVPWDEDGWPLKRRVGRHLTAFQELALALNDLDGKELILENVPSYEELMQNDVGFYLSPLNADIPKPSYRAYPGIWRLLSQK